MNSDFRTHPIDAGSAATLEVQGLRLALVDAADEKVFTDWLQSISRGFHGPSSDDEEIAEYIKGTGYRRMSGVWDDSVADAAVPVATVASWPTPLTVPGERSLPAWAVSAVTVAPTHRRKGIARSLMEAELRTAVELGIPMAMLTVSESTIYGRFGFAPAVMATHWKVDTRRAKWVGPQAPGRVHLVPLPALRAQAGELIERARLKTPGEVEGWDLLWDKVFAQTSSQKDAAKKRRGIRYDDESGNAQGFALYTVSGGDDDFAEHKLDVHYLLATTDDAYAGLWRYLLEVDLVATVNANLRAVDEPLAWLVDDFRAVKAESREDHLYLRVLDVKATLEARDYSADGTIVFDVQDPLGYAAGVFQLAIVAGRATVTPLDSIPDDAAALALSVNELGAIYLGGVTVKTLVRAGRVREVRSGSAISADAAFHSPVAPWLSIWF